MWRFARLRATAHHWARELIALGQEVKLMPPAYAKAYVPDHSFRAALALRDVSFAHPLA